MRHPTASPNEPGNQSSAISNSAVRLIAEYTGRGPTKAKTIISRDSVTILLGDTLTKGERKLVEHGERESVLATRHRLQEIMRDDLIAAVEVALERKVIAFMSANHVDPDMAAEVFVLEPEPDGDRPIDLPVRTANPAIDGGEE